MSGHTAADDWWLGWPWCRSYLLTYYYYEGYFRSLQPLSEPLVGGMPIRAETYKIMAPILYFVWVASCG